MEKILNIVINEIVEKCSEYINFSEIIYEEIEDLPYCIIGNIASFLNGDFCSDNENIYADFSEYKKIKSVKVIYDIFNKHIISVNDNVANLFIVGFFEGLNENEQNIITKMAKNKIKEAIVYFYVGNIITEYWPRDNKNMPIKLNIYEKNYNPVDVVLKIRNDTKKLEKELIHLSKKGLNINSDNINGIIRRIVKL